MKVAASVMEAAVLDFSFGAIYNSNRKTETQRKVVFCFESAVMGCLDLESDLVHL